MGHLPIVDSGTIHTLDAGQMRVQVRRLGAADPGTPQNILIQVADILADALAIRPGDPIFPWEVRTGHDTSFRRICRAASRARIEVGHEMPIVVPLQGSQRIFAGLREDEALELWTGRLLWNAIGKKSLGRGRSITHQTPFEDDELTSRLAASGELESLVSPATATNGVALDIGTTPEEIGEEDDHPEELRRATPGERFQILNPARIAWVRGSEFINEKALEAWLMANYDQPKGESLRGALLGTQERVVWAANYLPYGVAGASIDCVFLAEDGEGTQKLYVVELKKGRLSRAERAQASLQVERYSRYFARFLRSYFPDGPCPEVIGVALSGGSGPEGATSLPSHREIHYRVDPSGEVVFA